MFIVVNDFSNVVNEVFQNNKWNINSNLCCTNVSITRKKTNIWNSLRWCVDNQLLIRTNCYTRKFTDFEQMMIISFYQLKYAYISYSQNFKTCVSYFRISFSNLKTAKLLQHRKTARKYEQYISVKQLRRQRWKCS